MLQDGRHLHRTNTGVGLRFGHVELCATRVEVADDPIGDLGRTHAQEQRARRSHRSLISVSRTLQRASQEPLGLVLGELGLALPPPPQNFYAPEEVGHSPSPSNGSVEATRQGGDAPGSIAPPGMVGDLSLRNGNLKGWLFSTDPSQLQFHARDSPLSLTVHP